ncbi:response regulator [Desulfococcaceae bacterium HSG7]|nr:response regulator [Desulfococcaceae bacterium HSG7]
MFCVVLPKIKKDAKTEIKKEFEQPPGGQETILVVDDEDLIKELLRHNLESLGYTVFADNDALAALESFRQNPDQYDLIITDLRMPGLNGDKLAIEAMKIRPAMPVILCTGFSEMTDEKRAMEIGIKELVMKPIIRNQIARTIRHVLDG